MVWKALIGLALAAFPIAAEARHIQTSQVRYETQQGASRWHSIDVHFLMGAELNSATNSYRYNGIKPYAVIFFGDEKAAIIQIQTTLFCSFEFTSSCLPLLGKMKGRDQDGTEWTICTGDIC